MGVLICLKYYLKKQIKNSPTFNFIFKYDKIEIYILYKNLALSPFLKKLGNRLILSVAPMTRLLCIHDDIKIVLPQEYKYNKKTFEPLVKQLFSSKIKNNHASIYLKENINSLSPDKVPLETLDPWLQLIAILDLCNKPIAMFLYDKAQDANNVLVRELCCPDIL